MAAPVRDLGKIPGPVFIPNVVAVRLVWSLANNKKASNILHASFATTFNPAQAMVDALNTSIGSALTTSGLSTYLDNGTELTNVGLRDLSPIPGSVYGHGEWLSATAGVAGAEATADPLPAGVAFVISLKTGQSRQANRGRVYLPGFAENANDSSGKAVAAVGTNGVAFIEAVRTALGALTTPLSLCIAHPARQAYEGRTGVQYAARAAGYVPVTSVVALNLNWDSTRLRGRI